LQVPLPCERSERIREGGFRGLGSPRRRASLLPDRSLPPASYQNRVNDERPPALPNTESPLLELRLFGPFEARLHASASIAFPSRKAQWLLAYLALHADQEIARDRLAEIFWPDSEPQKALFNLRQTLSQLRQALGPAAECLHAQGQQSLRLEGCRVWRDIAHFEAALLRNERAGWEQAVEIYRGSLLPDCLEEWPVVEREARSMAYLNALESLAAGAMQQEPPGAAVRWLRRLVAADPYRESAYCLLMQALWEAGDRAALTKVYQDLRLRLRQDLNTDPSPETQALYRQLLRREERISLPPPPASTRESALRKLPVPLTDMIGREIEVEEVGGWLTARRLVTLTGTGGIGKTRLSIAVADAVAAQFPDGVWFVDLAPLTDPILVPKAIAKTLGLQEIPGRSTEEMLEESLSARTLLLILDNCEHLLDACAMVANRLLLAIPGLRILTTSRETLGLPGEQLYRVPSLPLPPPGEREKSATALLEYEAVRLFVERAVQANSDFRLTTQNVASVTAICHCLDGIPLALEMAAARTRSFSPREIQERLKDRFHLLTGGSRAALPRQRTMQAALDWSWDLLTTSERILLRRISAFVGGWTLEAAEAVCAGEKIVMAVEVPDLLASLTDKSLVVYETAEQEARYRLLETVRQYAAERLEEAGEHDTLRARHSAYFLAFAEEAEPQLFGQDQAEWLNRLECEHDNLRAAVETSIEFQTSRSEPQNTSPQTALRLCAALWRFWEVRGYLSEGRTRLATALAATPERTQCRAKALNGAGRLAAYQADYPEAQALHEESLEIAREVGDTETEAAALNNLGNVAYFLAEYRKAGAIYEQAVTLRRTLGDKRGLAYALGNLGNVAHGLGEFTRARDMLEESLKIHRELGDSRSIALWLSNLGGVYYCLEDYPRACAVLEEGLEILRELGDQHAIADSLETLGMVVRGMGETARARTLHEEALKILRRLGDRRHIAMTLRYLGSLARTEDDIPRARALLTESMQIAQEVADRRVLAGLLEAFAGLCARAEPERAAHLWGAAEVLREAISSPNPPAYKAEVEAEVAATLERADAASFAEAWTTGRTLPLEDAIEIALKEVP
jgi:predicted ATPase/DNA-binding SARP family transcriptional activator